MLNKQNEDAIILTFKQYFYLLEITLLINTLAAIDRAPLHLSYIGDREVNILLLLL